MWLRPRKYSGHLGGFQFLHAQNRNDSPESRVMPSVIVMDENEPLRALLAEWLTSAGYRVREGTLQDADNEEAVDLVVFDLPQLRTYGATLTSRVRAAFPGAALLGLSTQLRESLSSASALVRALGLSALLAKPCSRLELLAAVATALADSGAL